MTKALRRAVIAALPAGWTPPSEMGVRWWSWNPDDDRWYWWDGTVWWPGSLAWQQDLGAPTRWELENRSALGESTLVERYDLDPRSFPIDSAEGEQSGYQGVREPKDSDTP